MDIFSGRTIQLLQKRLRKSVFLNGILEAHSEVPPLVIEDRWIVGQLAPGSAIVKLMRGEFHRFNVATIPERLQIALKHALRCAIPAIILRQRPEQTRQRVAVLPCGGGRPQYGEKPGSTVYDLTVTP
ncbi:hypothetical protein BA898_05530 [Spiribacter roseus]|nr:hypothetical protein BA898_05530 [Spiribacter roseus]